MALLPSVEIESELSYAYVHAVAAKAGMSCYVPDRHLDALGVDAVITAHDDFGPGAILTDVPVYVQLKATIEDPRLRDGRLSYFLQGIERYDVLRRTSVTPPRILVVLFLPRETNEWLSWSSERLSMQRCAWWESLRGAPPSDNARGVTIYLPETQSFSPDALLGIMSRLAREEDLVYHG
jgi:hypothetical protein